MAKEPQATSPNGITFTEASLTALIQTVMAEARKETIAMVQEIRKPTEREQRKLDLEIKQERELRVRKVKETVDIERVKRVTQFACTHIKAAEGVHQQAHAFRGQVNSDNCCRPMCGRCFKEFPKFKVSEEQLKSGMRLHGVKNLTMEVLLRAHMQSFPDCEDCKAGNCAVRDLREKKAGKLDPEPTVLPDGKIRAAELTA